MSQAIKLMTTEMQECSDVLLPREKMVMLLNDACKQRAQSRGLGSQELSAVKKIDDCCRFKQREDDELMGFATLNGNDCVHEALTAERKLWCAKKNSTILV